jgi:hypothetical protein
MKTVEIGSSMKKYCNTCKVDTHHELKATHLRSYQEILYENTINEQAGFEEAFQYRFWFCRGCDTATLEEMYTNIGMYNSNTNDNEYEHTLYPRRMKNDLPYKNFHKLNSTLMKIYREVISSFNNELNLLCAIGLRCLLEGVCAEKGVAGKNLNERIDGLKIHLPSNIVDNLHGFRFMGNVAAHELQAPQTTELSVAIEVMEDLLNYLYDLEYKTQKLPKRP